ncbi:MAG: hypothetical protein JRJ87_07810 [Deltaproteobacteria bacterium]|nr:hypothetical protein [Deltaproteobacteria bacterium]
MTDRDNQQMRDWKKIVRQLGALPETLMRREVLIEKLQVMEPDQILGLLTEVMNGVAKRSPAHVGILDAVHEAIFLGQQQGPIYELLAEVYRLAREENNDAVARLLVIAKPQRGPIRAEDAPGDHEMSRLTLGLRKFLARGHDRTRLDRLLFDCDPAVVRNLLRNPHLTEQDVVRLTARRPTQVEIQREVYASRWGERYRIRLAMICNPYTPTDLSLKLLGFLLKKDLAMVRKDTGLHEQVRAEAQRLIDERRNPTAETVADKPED